MKADEFRKWAEGTISKNGIKDCVSRCRKVEAALGVDLDKEYRKDKGERLIGRLWYTMEDERNGKECPQGFEFKKGVNIRRGMTDLRSAVKRYYRFCKEG